MTPWFPDGDAAVYIEYFEAVYQNIKAVSPRTRVGGDYDRAYGIFLIPLLSNGVYAVFCRILCRDTVIQ